MKTYDETLQYCTQEYYNNLGSMSPSKTRFSVVSLVAFIYNLPSHQVDHDFQAFFDKIVEINS